MKEKIIALIDCDSFFVSCERVDNPSLQGQAVCVMSGCGNKGVVISRSSEAKSLGIKMGEPYFQLHRKFPQVICIGARHGRYCQISACVMDVIKRYSPQVEVVSIDEAYIDITGMHKIYKTTYTDIAGKIRQSVYQETKIPVSIGLSTSKTLAKLASDKAKNCGGIYVIKPTDIEQSIYQTNIEEVCGIGKQSAKLLNFHGIFSIKDFINKENSIIQKLLGSHGMELKFELSGKSINTVDFEAKIPQSIQDTQSFEDFSNNKEFLQSHIRMHIHNSSQKLRRLNGFCSQIGVILRSKDFSTFCLYDKFDNPTNSEFSMRDKALALLDKLYNSKIVYRSIGIELKKLTYNKQVQQNLFEAFNPEDDKISRVLDELEQKFGKDVVKLGL